MGYLEYYKVKLNDNEQKVYVNVLNCWKNDKKKVFIGADMRKDVNYSDVIEAVAKDHPELFWVDYYSFNIARRLIGDTIIFTYFFSGEYKRKLNSQVEEWKIRTINKLPSKSSTIDKAWLLFDYLARQVTYEEEGTPFSHTVVGVAEKGRHKAVCEGIAKAYKYLCDAANIPCRVAYGNVKDGAKTHYAHAWNFISNGESVLLVDVTRAIEAAHEKGIAERDFFLGSGKQDKCRYVEKGNSL